jgi:phosphoglycerate dehydrogenase-like enzyme
MHIWVDIKTLSDQHFQAIQKAFHNHDVSYDESNRPLAEIAILMPGLINEDFIKAMPHLRFVQCLTAGYDRADLSVLAKRGIQFAYAKDVFSIQIAEDVVSKILFINRRLGDYYDLMKEHTWQFKRVDHEIYGSTVGILGAGSIGREVAVRLKAFNCKIMGYKRTKIEDDIYDEIVTDDKGLNHLYQTSDIIVVALPLTEQTYHFVDKDALRQMKKTAILVNVARGDIIDQDALMDALNHDQIRAAALDVTSPEPLMPDHPLWTTKHLFITPHQASSSPMMHQRLIDEVIDTCLKYIHQENLDNIVSL